MSPELEVRTFGRTPAQSARGAVVLALLGIGAVAGVSFLLVSPRGVLGNAYLATGLPPWLPLALGVAVVFFLAGLGFLKAVARAPRLEISRDGILITGSLGRYRVDWDNVRDAGVTRSGALGLKLERREALLGTHLGTEQQREWLRTMEPFGEWDLVFPEAELGTRAETVLQALLPFLGR